MKPFILDKDKILKLEKEPDDQEETEGCEEVKPTFSASYRFSWEEFKDRTPPPKKDYSKNSPDNPASIITPYEGSIFTGLDNTIKGLLKGHIESDVQIEKAAQIEHRQYYKIDKTRLRPYDDKISKAHERRDYRPTFVGIIENGQNQLLLVQSVYGEDIWTFPQGGIEEGESLEECMRRELREEVGIDFDKDISYTRVCYFSTRLDDNKPERNRGFQRGKEYFFCYGFYEGDGNLVRQEEEVLDIGWFSEEEALKMLANNRSSKREVFEEGLDRSRLGRSIGAWKPIWRILDNVERRDGKLIIKV